MFQAILRASIRYRGWVVALWGVIGVAGVWSLLRLPLDAFPDTTPIQLQVNTVAPALTPLETERQITLPLERALSGIPGLIEVRSLSKFGLSQLTLTFEEGTDHWRARQAVDERLGRISLPNGISPELGPMASGLGEVFHYTVTGDAPLAELRTLNDTQIQPQLAAVPGVAEVNTWGGEERRIDVEIDPYHLQQLQVSLDQIAAAVEGHGNVGGGRISISGEATLIQGNGMLQHPSEVEQVVIRENNGIPLTLGQVGRVVESHTPRHGAVTSQGKGEVILGLGFAAIGEDHGEITQRLALRLEEIRSSLPKHVTVEVAYERTSLIDAITRTVEKNLLEGALLVIAIVFLFLGNGRAGLIVAAVIPLSMLFASTGMLALGIAGSLMSLGAIDFGLLVDSAIIQVENTLRRLSHSGDAPEKVVEAAAWEVRKPTLYGELILLAVYLPILTLGGIEGKLFRPMALTVCLALIGSFLASITLIPALSSWYLRHGISEKPTLVMRVLQALYAPILRFSLARPTFVLAAAGLVLANAAFLSTRLGTEFVPKLSEGTLVANTVRLASISLDESVRYGLQIEKMILARFPNEVEQVWSRTGTAEIATDPMGVELTDVFIRLKPRDQWTRASTQTELVERMNAELRVLPGMRIGFAQPIELRMNEMVAGIRSDVGIKLFGDDLDLLKRKATEIARVLETIPGAREVTTEQITGVPTLQIDVDPQRLGRRGLSTPQALQTIQAIHGLEVGELQQEERRIPIALRWGPAWRQNTEDIGVLPVASPSGAFIPLAYIAEIGVKNAPSTISRERGKRRVVIQANVRGRDLGSFAKEAEQRIRAEVTFPEGGFFELAGQVEHYRDARQRLMWAVPCSLVLIFGLLYATYGRLLDAARVFIGVPFAAAGGVFALWWRDLPFSVSAAVGFIALAGMSVLADMVLVSGIHRRISDGILLRLAVEQAALERLRPVAMTALAASIGFLPMALNNGIGAEVQRPLATVVIGGLFSSTLLSLVVLPVLFTKFRKDS